MKPHKLDRKIVIEKESNPIKDTTGQTIKQWTTFCSPWAQVVFNPSSERYEQNIEVQKQRVSFIIRYRPGITGKMRVLFEGNIYDIEGPVQQIKRKEMLQLNCITRQ